MALKGAATAVATAASGVTGNDGAPPMPYFVDTLFRGDTAPAADPSDAQTRAEIARIFVADIRSGTMGPADVRYLGQVVARKTGMSQADAEKRVADSFTQASTAVANAENKARQAADDARKAAAFALMSSRCSPARSAPASPRSSAGAGATSPTSPERRAEAEISFDEARVDRSRRSPGGSRHAFHPAAAARRSAADHHPHRPLLALNAMTRIADIMTRSIATVRRDETLQAAAERMREMDVGALPVLDGTALAGMVTDRDITVRGVAAGMIPQEALVSDVMTEDVRCRADDSVEDVMAQMGKQQVRRLAVLDAGNEIVGIVALGDIATRQSAHTDETLREISTPGR